MRSLKYRPVFQSGKATTTLEGNVRGNDRNIASVVWQVTLKYMGALIGT